MGPFLKKDVFLTLRDWKELVLLILMPFVLIAILGFALGGFIDSGSSNLDLDVILVNEENEAEGIKRFKREIHAEKLPEQAKDQLLKAAESLRPQQWLRNVLESDELSEILKLSVMDKEAARQKLERDEADAIVIIPPDFTYNALNKMLLDRGQGAVIGLETPEFSALQSGIISDILNRFVRSVNFQTALGQTAGPPSFAEDNRADVPKVQGGVVPVSSTRPLSPTQYYTFGMAVMFVLYVASSISSRAYLEKRNNTYDRIILAGAHPLLFLGGKAVSAATIAFIQLVVLFVLSSLIFQSFAGQTWSFWVSLISATSALALCVGALSAMLTALNFRLSSGLVSDLFGSTLVALLAFLGGSFFPTSQMPVWLNQLGEWTPNGAALASYLQMAQGADAARWLSGIFRLILTTGCLMAASVWIFPKRRIG